MKSGVILFVAASLVGCSGGAFAPTSPSSFVAPGASGISSWSLAKAKQHENVYWTLFAGATDPQLQIAKVPLRAKSKVRNIKFRSKNDLLYTSGLTIDSAGRLWALSYDQYAGSPTTALVFKLPIKHRSAPLYTFILSGTSQSDAVAFDPSGNLWVTSPGNSSVVQYAGPFTKSKTLSPAITISGVGTKPYGIAVDSSAKVYISDANSSGKQSIRVFKPPYKKAYFLDGLTGPGGLIFDKQGNLYASSSSADSSAVVRYNFDHLGSGDKPSIVDSTDLPTGTYEAAFAFTASGDLYAANCGRSESSAAVDIWPLSQSEFSSTLAPVLQYSNAKITKEKCVWGIAIK